MTDRLFDQGVLAELRENVGAEQLRMLLDLLPEESAKCLSEIKAALAQGDLDGAHRYAHRLKGVAGNIGACKVASLARELELESPTLDAASDRLASLDMAVEETNRGLASVA